MHILDFGNDCSTAIFASSTEPNGIITVISEGQLQEASGGATYEYIPLQGVTGENGGTDHVVATPQTRDALQEALASAEVDKLDLLRTADGTVIYESSDSQSNNQVRFWKFFLPCTCIIQILQPFPMFHFPHQGQQNWGC